MAYDDQNIFAKILRGEIPNKTIYEDDQVLAFWDIQPAKPAHGLVIPKGGYTDMDDFTARASAEEKVALLDGISKVAKELGVTETGYRVITNIGDHGGQEVPHLHFHVLGGAPVGRMVPKCTHSHDKDHGHD